MRTVCQNDISTAFLATLGRIYHHIVDTFEDVILDDLSSTRSKPAVALLRLLDDQLESWKSLGLAMEHENPLSSWNTGFSSSFKVNRQIKCSFITTMRDYFSTFYPCSS